MDIVDEIEVGKHEIPFPLKPELQVHTVVSVVLPLIH
jgi:hypothetical protein